LLAKRFGKHGITWRVLEVQASDAAVKQRLRVREAKPDEVSDARLEDFNTLTQLYEPPVELSTARYLPVQTNAPLDKTAAKTLKALSDVQMEHPCPSP
jgi:hypothetical protein